jgi:serpin B
VKSANGLWLQEGLPTDPTFCLTLQEHYRAEVSPVDFARNPKQARALINSWVAKHTEGKIQEMVNQDTVHGRTRMVFANAVYFKQ